jgi:hypothetical protein
VDAPSLVGTSPFPPRRRDHHLRDGIIFEQ